ncbi:PREDICTED: tripartite motif-containing protein 2-like [Amphimedon queenslandica]|uniref:Tripartite motif-containing protein 2-like n=1 Tax=Amphimedon queenslandica TaxID=400682 RepID=A0AAN0IQ74_AMPQE|nr:PREDICTED: tripartite motif-containing protein 2-like [Amphimedon queenslandica]|eukprot:XP_011407226.1 PREDICTED: tripartite motif-containing protein 2-like [Amphimedon queenslandica]
MAENTSPAITMTCEVCSEYYTDPLMLPCLHSFCKKCLIKAKEKQGSADTSLKCPTCDTSVNLPDGKIEGLTQNLWLAQQVKEASVKDKMSKKESTLCEQCSDDTAVTFCCECWLFLCDFCKTAHKRIKITSQHKLVNMGKESVIEELPVTAQQPVYCPRHPRSELLYYCNDCEVMTCLNCLPTKHKDHAYDDYIDVGETARKALKESVGSCDGVIPPVTEAIANGEKMLEQIATRKEEVRQKIKETFEKLKAALDKRCNDLLMETEEIASAKRNSVKKQLDRFHKLVKQVSHGRHLASSVSERTDPGEVLSVKKLITNQLEECIEEYKKLPLEIEENEAILTSLDTTVISNEIGKYGGVFKVDADFYSVDSGQAIPLATVQKERKFKLAINIPVPLDKALQHVHASFTKNDGSKEEGRVVNDNNTAIVSCTPKNNGGYELSVTVRGHHIKGSPYQLSVKASRDYTTLTNQRSFNVGSRTPGVAVHTNGEVFASSHNGGFVQVFSEDGTAVRRIGSKGNGGGEFQCTWGLLLVGDRLYVSDVTLHRAQYFSATTGQYIGQFGSNGNRNGQFSTPHGMSTDGKGNILVADYGNKRVQVFKEDGTFVQVIQCDGNASDVAVDNEGKIHVTISDQSHVQVFSPDGKNQLDAYKNNISSPQGIAIDDEGYIFVLNNNSCLDVLSPDRKHVIKSISFAQIYGVALDKDGYIYVADYGNSRIMKY